MLKIKQNEYVNEEEVRSITIGDVTQSPASEFFFVEVKVVFFDGSTNRYNLSEQEAGWLEDRLDGWKSKLKDIPDESHKLMLSLLELMRPEKVTP